MSVRAKFRLVAVRQMADYSAKELEFSAQYDQSIEEDRRFFKATPSGTFKMMVDNPLALEQLQLGGYYYLDLTPVG